MIVRGTMKINLENKIALVSGNTAGIGLAITKKLRECGANVPDVSRRTGYDLSRTPGYKKLIKDYPTCDILVNCVGGGGRWGTDDFEAFEHWNDVYYKNAGLATRLTMKMIPHMQDQGWGRVISIASIYGKEAGGRPWFTMAKSSEIALMKSLAGYYFGITFNSISPGHIRVKEEEDLKSIDPQFIGIPEDVANIALFLCSEQASFINGANIVVDGGFSRSF